MDSPGPRPGRFRQQLEPPNPLAVSPELALVDPDLAADARRSLAIPDDTVDRLLRASVEGSIRPLTTETAALEGVVHERTAPERGAPAASMPSRASWTKRAALVAGVVAAAVLALAFDVRVEIGGSPAVADVPAGSERPVVRGVSVSRPTEVPKSTEPSKGKSASGGQTARPRAKQPVAAAHKPKARARNAGAKSKRGSQQQAGRRFSWAPVPRASAYYIEFFRGSARVFAATTRRAEVAVPRQWRFGGRVQKLAPGDYRWYVWPVFGETGRAPAASVQARLRIK